MNGKYYSADELFVDIMTGEEIVLYPNDLRGQGCQVRRRRDSMCSGAYLVNRRDSVDFDGHGSSFFRKA